MKNKSYFPMYVDISNRNVVVVGGGKVGTRRVKTLLHFTRNITVIAPKMTAEMIELVKLGKIHAEFRTVKRSDLKDAYIVIAATDDWKVNYEISKICKEEGIYSNNATDHENCDFYFPGVVIQDEVVVGVTASGLNHRKAKEVRQEIEKTLKRFSGDQKDE
ncbi:MAG: NAD-binding protein [Blautia sp.]|nr:NAD-binding protein [Blautia sp.]